MHRLVPLWTLHDWLLLWQIVFRREDKIREQCNLLENFHNDAAFMPIPVGKIGFCLPDIHGRYP